MIIAIVCHKSKIGRQINNMITVEHLTKRYGDITAVDDLSFEIKEGHVYGFLGPNGAGKTTTVQHRDRFLSATEGTCSGSAAMIF